MKIAIIPDVHGRTFWQNVNEVIDEVDKVIFLGDYLDPYPHEGINFETSKTILMQIINFKAEYPDKVINLIGNHDYYYLYTNRGFCSRHEAREEKEVKPLLEMLDLQVAYKVDKYIFSHAGICPKWLDMCKLTLEDVLTKSIEDLKYSLEYVGYLRGGYDAAGSCIWCDAREFVHYYIPYKNVFQIFGHTMVEHELVYKNLVCLDCQTVFVLDTETADLIKIN